MNIFLDFETASLENIKDVGAYKYLAHPSTQLVVLAVESEDSSFKACWNLHDIYKQNKLVIDFLEKEIAKGSILFAHNADFEYEAFKNFPFVTRPKPEQLQCTAVMARRAGLASGLGFVAETLGLVEHKDKIGKHLIQFFHAETGYNFLLGEPQPDVFNKKGLLKPKKTFLKILQEEYSFEQCFEMYCEYCIQDVTVTKEIYQRLKYFCPEIGDDVHKSFCHNLRMNERGFPVDVSLLEKANAVYEKALTQNTENSENLCGFRPSQNKALLDWLNSQGVEAVSLDSKNVETLLSNPNLDDTIRKVLICRENSAFAAAKKIPAALNAQVFGRIHGGFMFSGAVRTHRTAGKGVQPHNFKRPDSLADAFTENLEKTNTDFETLDFLYGPLVERVAMSARHFIREPHSPMWNIDFSQIEARLTVYVPGQEDVLQGFRDGLCPYTNMAARIYKCKYEDIGKTSMERFLGKQAVLLCGYAGGAQKFSDTCKGYGQDVPIDLAEFAVSSYRVACPKVVQSWKILQHAAISALIEKSLELDDESKAAIKLSKFEATDTNVLEGKAEFEFCNRTTGLPTLLLHLYSGHTLSYPFPFLKRIKGHRSVCKTCRDKAFLQGFTQDEINQANKERIKRKSSVLKMGALSLNCECLQPFTSLGWGYKKFDKGGMKNEYTHGGKILENMCQALAGDHLNFALAEAEKVGFHSTMVIHDEALGPFTPGLDLLELDRAFQTSPPWALDFPLKAEGKLVKYYTKD